MQNLLLELIDHPKTGTGKPQLKRYNLSGLYSRRVTDKHRLIYEIFGREDYSFGAIRFWTL